MKKLAVAALVLSSLSGGAYAHEAGEFFIRAGSATVRPTEGLTCPPRLDTTLS